MDGTPQTNGPIQAIRPGYHTTTNESLHVGTNKPNLGVIRDPSDRSCIYNNWPTHGKRQREQPLLTPQIHIGMMSPNVSSCRPFVNPTTYTPSAAAPPKITQQYSYKPLDGPSYQLIVRILVLMMITVDPMKVVDP